MEEKIIIETSSYLTSKFRKKAIIVILILAFIFGFIITPFISGGLYFQDDIRIFILTCIVLISYALLLDLCLKKAKITVTDKRVYGSTVFGKLVSLPLDSISAVGIINPFKGIAIASSSGKIRFFLIKQNQEVYDAISKLLIERQNKSPQAEIKNNDNIENLKRYKELLDMGAITQEEYDSKKKELLNK